MPPSNPAPDSVETIAQDSGRTSQNNDGHTSDINAETPAPIGWRTNEGFRATLSIIGEIAIQAQELVPTDLKETAARQFENLKTRAWIEMMYVIDQHELRTVNADLPESQKPSKEDIKALAIFSREYRYYLADTGENPRSSFFIPVTDLTTYDPELTRISETQRRASLDLLKSLSPQEIRKMIAVGRIYYGSDDEWGEDSIGIATDPFFLGQLMRDQNLLDHACRFLQTNTNIAHQISPFGYQNILDFYQTIKTELGNAQDLDIEVVEAVINQNPNADLSLFDIKSLLFLQQRETLKHFYLQNTGKIPITTVPLLNFISSFDNWDTVLENARNSSGNSTFGMAEFQTALKDLLSLKDSLLETVLRNTFSYDPEIGPFNLYNTYSTDTIQILFKGSAEFIHQARSAGITDQNIALLHTIAVPKKSKEEITQLAVDSTVLIQNAKSLTTEELEKIHSTYENLASLVVMAGKDEMETLSPDTKRAIKEIRNNPDMQAIIGNCVDVIFKNVNKPKKAKEILLIFADHRVQSAILPGGILSDSPLSLIQHAITSPNSLFEAITTVELFLNPSYEYPDKLAHFALAQNGALLQRADPIWTQMTVPHPSSGNEILFAQLNPKDRKKVLLQKLRASYNETKSKEAIVAANTRNRNLPTDHPSILNNRSHGTSFISFSTMLTVGNLCGECVAKSNKSDTYPFLVDFVPPMSDSKKTFKDSTERLTSFEVATNHQDGVVVLFEPVPTNAPFTVALSNVHTVEFAITPATKITGVVLTYTSENNWQEEKERVAQNPFYAPLYDIEGKLIFTSSEYDRIRRENNLDLPLTAIDGSLRITNNLGANPGGTYLIPTIGISHGEKRYIKHAPRDRLWNEWLADTFYQDAGIATPKVDVVTVDGTLGHSSVWLNTNGSNAEGQLRPVKDGFIFDAWMANWDIPYNNDNTLIFNDGAVRLDNGGALLFRATGQRKDLKGGIWPFTETVGELNLVSDHKAYGNGMRSAKLYKELTDADIKKQCQTLKTVFTDEHIDDRIEHTQLSPEDRENLKRTLKARRNYILRYYQI